MSSVNKVILVGRLGADPELRFGASGKARCKLSLATNRQWTDGDGQRQEETAWHRVTVFGRQAENCRAYLRRGQQAYVEGRLQRRHYQDKEGVKRYATDVIAHRVIFLGSKGLGDTPSVEPPAESEAPLVDEELPF